MKNNCRTINRPGSGSIRLYKIETSGSTVLLIVSVSFDLQEDGAC